MPTDLLTVNSLDSPCLGFVKGVCCPHYDEEPERIPFVKDILINNEIDECIAIEGFCALHLINGSPVYSVSFDKNNCVCTESYIHIFLHK